MLGGSGDETMLSPDSLLVLMRERDSAFAPAALTSTRGIRSDVGVLLQLANLLVFGSATHTLVRRLVNHCRFHCVLKKHYAQNQMVHILHIGCDALSD
jgi:hypothetical protein